jgi:hypothetical protein
MALVTGTITHGGTIIVKNAAIDLQPTGAPGAHGAHGFCSLPSGVVPPPPGTTCLLALADGRSGEIIISGSSHGPNGTVVQFATSGDFK